MDLEVARLRMVDAQIAARGVRDARALDAMRAVPRHLFVPEHLRDVAYDDRPLPIGEGQTISQPFMVALMTAMLTPRESDRVLEIATRWRNSQDSASRDPAHRLPVAVSVSAAGALRERNGDSHGFLPERRWRNR